MMSFLDQACDAAPLYFLDGAIMVLAILLAALILVIVWPMHSPVRISEADAMAEPFGDQPDLPPRGFARGGFVDCSKLPRWRR
jgi:hypothetical protein